MGDDILEEQGTPPDLNALAKDHVDQIYDVKNLSRLERVIANGIQTAISNAIGAVLASAPAIGRSVGKVFRDGEEDMALILAPFLAKFVGLILGVDVPAGAIHESTNPEHSVIGDAVGAVAMKAVRGGVEGELKPSDEPAKQFIGVLAHIITHCWAEGIVLEKLEGYTSWSGHIETIAQLGKELVDGMGLSRLARVALRPLAQTALATPLQWKVNKDFRPTLLSASAVARQFARNKWEFADVEEELARQGYSVERIDAVLNEQLKFLSPSDVAAIARHVGDRPSSGPPPSGGGGQEPPTFVVSGTFDPVAYLGDAGYDERAANFELQAEAVRRLEAEQNALAAACIDAFARNDIDNTTFHGLIGAVVGPADEQRRFRNLGDLRQSLNVRHMSQGEVLDALDHLILPVAFYRDWLKREGYPEDEATALELLYITKRNEKADVFEERKRIAKEKADEQAARDAAKQQRQTELEAERALRRRGSLSDLRRAYARGLITRDRLAEVLNAEFDADTVATLLEDADVDRANEAAREQAAADAKQRAARKQIDVGALEQAVLHHILTVQAYADALTARGFDGGDVSILAATLAARLKDQDDAVRQRAQAAQAAAVKHIDLVRFEHLVRRGLRTIDDYDALLRTLGFEEAARAAMKQLLSVQIADDARAQQLRDASAAKAGVKELSLEQFRRAVILELKSETDYGNFVAKQGYTPDAAAVLVAELGRDVADADAARAKRLAAEASAGVVDLPLSRATAAARLGVITPDAYAVRLKRAGYSDDDIAIEMELLLVEIADTQAARATRDRLAAAIGPARALSLAQLAQAVKVGTATIDQYRAAAAALYAPDDVDTLAATLEAEAQTHADARARHDAIDTELSSRALSLGELEGQVKAGTLSIAAYKAQLAAWGYEKDDTQLLATLLV